MYNVVVDNIKLYFIFHNPAAVVELVTLVSLLKRRPQIVSLFGLVSALAVCSLISAA